MNETVNQQTEIKVRIFNRLNFLYGCAVVNARSKEVAETTKNTYDHICDDLVELANLVKEQ